MARSKSSKQWLKEHFEDEYVRQSKESGLRSRASFKLLEIQEKDKRILNFSWNPFLRPKDVATLDN